MPQGGVMLWVINEPAVSSMQKASALKPRFSSRIRAITR
jgi:hypothetical protein